MPNNPKIASNFKLDNIYIRIFLPKEPKIILQIIPGLSDYIDRYQDFANYLNQHNILVIGHDHLGQGKSVTPNIPLGEFGKNGEDNLIENTYRISKLIKKQYPDLPFFILGHSMGSMIITQLLKKKPTMYNGVIMLSVIKAPKISDLLLKIINPIARVKSTKLTKKMNNLVYQFYNRDFQLNSRLAWVTNNQSELEKLKKDPLIGYDYTINSLVAVLKLTIASNQSDWLKQLPKDFPILAMSGTLDPAGDYGFRLMELANEFEKNNLMNTKTKLCYEMQHELLNDRNAKKVFRTIDEFILTNSEEIL